QSQPFARGDVEALETAALRRGDGRLEEHLGAPKRFPRGGVDACAVASQIHLFADLDSLDFNRRASFLEDGKRGVHDLRTDAVTMGDRDGNFGCHRGFSSITMCGYRSWRQSRPFPARWTDTIRPGNCAPLLRFAELVDKQNVGRASACAGLQSRSKCGRTGASPSMTLEVCS